MEASGRCHEANRRLGWVVLPLRLALAALCASLLGLPGVAQASPGLRVLHYRGHQLTVPADWPVFDLAEHPAVCVRFDRHAVYLGQPGSEEICPSQPAGRTEAILVQPITTAARGALPAPGLAAADAPQGTEARIIDRGHHLLITVTWNHQPATIARALGVRVVVPASAASTPPAPPARILMGTRERLSSLTTAATSTPGQTYTGQAFDACSTPSGSEMSAWSGAYRAIGVYIGGANMACSQTNLTAHWVSQESAAGWHLVPIYVGLQAPSNYCGCAAISSTSAAGQGRAAARDAVAQAQSVGLGTGNPIYYDMEGYPSGGGTSAAVLSFLGAWTQALHAAGYQSGVYSSDDSGISDLAARYGTGYPEPDDIWAASWDGRASTADASIPTGDWANHQRIHQYAGNLNQTHGGVTINIDSDYVDGATAAAGSRAVGRPPTASAPPLVVGSAIRGQTLTEKHGSWSGNPSAYTYRWERCNGAGQDCAQIAGATGQGYALGAGDLGHTIRVLESAANGAGVSAAISSAATAVVQNPSSYWLFTGYGNVYTSAAALWYGSPASARPSGSFIAGLAPTPDGRGYWLVDPSGHVYSYGDARSLAMSPALSLAHPIVGIVASPTGGYWLYTAYGNVYSTAGTAWYGSPASAQSGDGLITGMASTLDGKGYWLVDSSGHVYRYGDAASLSVAPSVSLAHPILGIVNSPAGGYLLYTAYGNVYTSSGTPWYGSPYAAGAADHAITAMARTADGRGYWLVDSSGRVYHYGDAPSLSMAPALASTHPPIIGIAG